MELNSWNLVKQDGERVLHNSAGMLHANMIHPVMTNSNSDCTMMRIDVNQENSTRNLNRMVMDGRIQHGDRNDYMTGIDNESLDFSQLEDFINNEAESAPLYFGESLSHTDGNSSVLNTVPSDQLDPSNRTMHHHRHHLSQPLHQHLVLKAEVVASISPHNNYSNAISSIPVDSSSYPYAHSHHSLPDNSPESGSEPPYSPQDTAGHSPMYKSANGAISDILLHQNEGSSNGLVTLQYVKSPLQHTLHMQNLCTENILLQHSSNLTPLLTQQQRQQAMITSPESPNVMISREASMAVTASLNNTDGESYLTPHRSRKRRLSHDSNTIHVKQEPEMNQSMTIHTTSLPTVSNTSNVPSQNDDDYGYQEGNSNGSANDSGSYSDSNFQCTRFQPFQQTSWHTLCDQNQKELPVPHYRVDADKGFNFSNVDDAFVCQKKNHFQITCHAQLEGDAQFVKTNEGFCKISSFHLHFYGVKVESPTQTIKVEQSQSDRSKKAFHPVQINLRSDQVTKITVGRLHFSETTSNNMRKKGKPNPDQRYFYLVVGLHAHCSDSSNYAIVSHSSEKIIVRASNPGQFENDVELCWQRGSSPESVFHAGRVGINTDRPDEALVVHGNVKISGQIMKPSDKRIKTNIERCNTREQLRNIQKLNIVRYNYIPQFSSHFGLIRNCDTGVIAQEVQKIIPEAVFTAENVILYDGTSFDNFLLVNKERIYMENVGAVKELSKMTNNLENRINELERKNGKLLRLHRRNETKLKFSSQSIALTKEKPCVNFENQYRIRTKFFKNRNNSSSRSISTLITIWIFMFAICLLLFINMHLWDFPNTWNSCYCTPVVLSSRKSHGIIPQWLENTLIWSIPVNINQTHEQVYITCAESFCRNFILCS